MARDRRNRICYNGTVPQPRDPQATRRVLLEAAFEDIDLHGYQAASLDRIVERTALTKGALFHHFANKQALGYAVVDEVIRAMIEAQWVMPLASATDPLVTIERAFAEGVEGLAAQPSILGCPLNNLAQEMSPIDEGFRERTQAVFDLWMGAYDAALQRGRAAGTVANGIETRDAAAALVSHIEGTLSLAKNSQSRDTLDQGLRNLRAQLAVMRA